MSEITRSKQTIQQLYDQVLPTLAQQVHQSLEPVLPMFENFGIELIVDTWTRGPRVEPEEEISIAQGNVLHLGIRVRLESFNRPGAEPFDLTKNLLFTLEEDDYTVGPDKQHTWLRKEYLQRWGKEEYASMAVKWSEEIIDDMTQRLEKLM